MSIEISVPMYMSQSKQICSHEAAGLNYKLAISTLKKFSLITSSQTRIVQLSVGISARLQRAWSISQYAPCSYKVGTKQDLNYKEHELREVPRPTFRILSYKLFHLFFFLDTQKRDVPVF